LRPCVKKRRGRQLVINEKRVEGRYNELAVKCMNDGVNRVKQFNGL